MPELPEVESARTVIEKLALRRKIADVDDTDTYECRPHVPGQLREALVGRTLTTARRRGKSMWCETSGVARSRTPGPNLGLHLGMSGRIIVTDTSGEPSEGGDRLGRYASAMEQIQQKPVWVRFTLIFADGGSLMLFDKRRLGRVRLDPDIEALGPDAEQVKVAEFREIMSRGSAPVKARLLDQSAIAGVGNLLADETLWQAEIDPRRRVNELSGDELTVLQMALHQATKAAIRHGGVHTGEIIEHRHAGGHCPRCGAEMLRGTVGGRTTWWCSAEQV